MHSWEHKSQQKMSAASVIAPDFAAAWPWRPCICCRSWKATREDARTRNDMTPPTSACIEHWFLPGNISHNISCKSDPVFVFTTFLNGEFKAKIITALNEHSCLIKSYVLHESDNLCQINTMFWRFNSRTRQRLFTQNIYAQHEIFSP